MTGVIHYEPLKPGETVTANVYFQHLKRLKEKLKQKQPALVNQSPIQHRHP